MSKSRNDYRRNRFNSYDDEYNYREVSSERYTHRKEKRLRNALHTKNIDLLYNIDDE